MSKKLSLIILSYFIFTHAICQTNLSKKRLKAKALTFLIDMKYDSSYVCYQQSNFLSHVNFTNNDDLYNFLSAYTKSGHSKEAFEQIKKLKLTPYQYKMIKGFKDIKKMERSSNLLVKHVVQPNAVVIDRIDSLFELDQSPRLKKEVDYTEVWKNDSLNFEAFLDLNSQFGFPSRLLVGEKGFREVLHLMHHFSYEKIFYDRLAPVLLEAYSMGIISGATFAYIVDMHYERYAKKYFFGNEAYYQDDGKKELAPSFLQNPCTVDSIELNRMKYGLIPLKYHQKAVKKMYKKSVILSILGVLFRSNYYRYHGHWVYSYKSSKQTEIQQSQNTTQYYNCNQ